MWWVLIFGCVGAIISRWLEQGEFSSTAWREEQKCKAAMSNDEYLPININTALSFLHKEGFVAEPIDNEALFFKYQGESHVIRISPDNYIQLSKGFSLDDSSRELLEAVMQTMADIRCCKILIRQDCVIFTIETFVNSWTNFTTYFYTYMEVLEEAQRCLYDCFTRIRSEDEGLLAQAQRSGIC